MELLKKSFVEKIKNANISERCLLISKFYGDEVGIQFWGLVTHFLSIYSKNKGVKEETSKEVTKIIEEEIPTKVIIPTQNEEIDTMNQSFPQLVSEEKLPVHFNLLRSGEEIKETEKIRAQCFENCRAKENLQMGEKSVKLHIYLEEKITAVDILLQTPTEEPLYYQNALKACLISSTVNREFFENTMKRVSTNLVSSGMVDRGVELLCLIGSHIEACRHLQNADRWRDASWLAKIALPNNECSQIMKDWASLLENMDNKQEGSHYKSIIFGYFYSFLFQF